MSVTVADILHLPTMRGAEVVAGKGGLGKAVTGVSVLEYAVPGNMTEMLFQTNRKYMGNELCISGFSSCPEDPGTQRYIIRHMANVGMVCMVLYYVGIFVKQIDPLVLEEADRLDFPLVCMPRNRMDLRYADLISEAMELIVNDRRNDRNMSAEIISQLLYQPENQRTVNTALRMLSSRLHTSLVLTSENYRTLDESVWPVSSESIAESLVPAVIPKNQGVIVEFPPLPRQAICKVPVALKNSNSMWLFLIGEKDALRVSAAHAAAEAVRQVVEIWSNHHSDLVRSEIVRAILHDEPIKMRQLAGVLHTDIASMHSILLLRPNDPREVFSPHCEKQIADLAGLYGLDGIASLYAPAELVFVFTNTRVLSELRALTGEVVALLESSIPGGVTLTAYPYLENPAEVREAYLTWCETLPTARTIQPVRKVFHSRDIDFARQASQAIASGEEHIRSILHTLEPLRDPLFLETLETYLLDAGSNAALCAQMQHIHRNTVKYRLHRIDNILGFSLGEMPATAQIYLAAAVRRLLRS